MKTEMSSREAQLVVSQAARQGEAGVWGEPITAGMKMWAECAEWHFDETVWTDHKGVLNQAAAVAIASRDKKLKRKPHELDI